MTLLFRSYFYLIVVFIGVFTSSCSTIPSKRTGPVAMQESPPLEKADSKIPPLVKSSPQLPTTSKIPKPIVDEKNLEYVIESFTFPFDSKVEKLLHSPETLEEPDLMPVDSKAEKLLHSPDTLEEPDLTPEPREIMNQRDPEVIEITSKSISSLTGESKSTFQIERMLSQASDFIGVPYRRGGSSPRGFDCSGLVYYTLKNLGISVPRSAHDQYLHSKPIAKSELRPGDLVFFKIHHRSQRITHVGIYLGDNQFIHARSGGRKVAITNLSDKYYQPRFVRGGRII